MVLSARKRKAGAVIGVFLGTLLLAAAVQICLPAQAANRKRTAAKKTEKQICGMPQEEIGRLVRKCVVQCRNWNYRCIVDDPVWMGGRRWDCSSFVQYFYNEYLLPRSRKLNKSVRFQITDEAGKLLVPWAYYPYQAKDGALVVNNTVTILENIGTSWEEKKVSELVRSYRRYLNGKKFDPSVLPEPGDLLLYGIRSRREKVVKHVGIYLGEIYGSGKGYYMAECATGKSRRILGMKKSKCFGNRNGAAINPFWVNSDEKKQTLLWVKHFVSPEPAAKTRKKAD